MEIKLAIVDDAPFIREVLRHIFEATEIAVIGEAHNGEEAVTMARKLRPDIILMDLVMPLKSGIDATKEILEEFPDTKIIACSTIDQNTMVMRALEAGCSNYITKPFKSEDVLAAVRAAISKENKEVGRP